MTVPFIHRAAAALTLVCLAIVPGSPAQSPTPTPALQLATGQSAPAAFPEASPGLKFDQSSPTPSSPQSEVPSLHLRGGKITLQDGLADLNLPEGFRYLDKSDTRKVLVDAWGNPPEAADGQLGMIVPADFHPESRESYGVIISYDGSGYVKDDDAAKINYDDLLKKMQAEAQERNKARVKEGYPEVELVGWAAPPRYDAANKKMYWAKQLRFKREGGTGGEAGPDHDSLNYDVRILGRRGVLILQAVANMDQLDQIRDATPQILGMVNYNEGHRYADFNPKTDKVAAYGLAALVAGGIAAKAGLFKVLIGGLIALKKFVVIGVVAVIGFFKRLFKGNDRAN